MRITKILALAVVSLLAFEGAALADPPAKPAAATATKPAKDSGYDVMTFPTDPLFNQNLGNNGMTIGAGPGVVRQILARPRVSFVPELMKSIEQI